METIVSKILPDDLPRKEDSIEGDRYAHLARINWRLNATIQFGGNELEADKFLRRVSWGKYRAFTDEDGREYKWLLGARSSELYLNDESKTPVAKFHPKNIGSFFGGEKRPASLEIFPIGESQADLIMITFLFVEKSRRDLTG
ncbi:hypothetical protein V5O48_014061 [Marasmius crinis-equi]|uniref:DUF6593 domain-containing protein n=1 Tax=Marasmius crinis-equi TaxID=585013 RepID=A0ABR3EYD1_9AGAR